MTEHHWVDTFHDHGTGANMGPLGSRSLPGFYLGGKDADGNVRAGSAADWDLRADEQAVGGVVRAAMNRLSRSSAGTMRAVVVTRLRDAAGPPAVQAVNSAGRDCDTAWDHDGDTDTADRLPWCEPMVLNEVRPNPDPDSTAAMPAWNGGGDCAALPSDLPAQGAAFGANAPVLPQEGTAVGGGAAPAASEWISRSLQPAEWWVVVEICAHYGRGAESGFSGGALVNLGRRVLGMPTTMRRRVAWGALEPLDDCQWCVPAAAPSTPAPTPLNTLLNTL